MSTELQAEKPIDKVREMLKNLTPAGEQSLASHRALWEQNADTFPTSSAVRVEKVKLDDCFAERVQAKNATTNRVILYFHGGGYALGSARSHRHLAARLSEASAATVFTLDYRRAPEHPFPAAVEDATAAYEVLLQQIRPEHFAVGGDSAGGALTLATLLSARDKGLPMPAAAVLLSPFVDLTCSGDTHVTRASVDPIVSRDVLQNFISMYLGTTDRRNPMASPVFADLTGMPPLMIQVGDHETLLAEALLLADQARKVGVPVRCDVWPEMIHVWQLFWQILPEGAQAVDQVGLYLKERWQS